MWRQEDKMIWIITSKRKEESERKKQTDNFADSYGKED